MGVLGQSLTADAPCFGKQLWFSAQKYPHRLVVVARNELRRAGPHVDECLSEA
jgi:hypothetical protein